MIQKSTKYDQPSMLVAKYYCQPKISYPQRLVLLHCSSILGHLNWTDSKRVMWFTWPLLVKYRCLYRQSSQDPQKTQIRSDPSDPLRIFQFSTISFQWPWLDFRRISLGILNIVGFLDTLSQSAVHYEIFYI